MKNILIAGDLHISSDSLEECKLILEEQKELIKKYNVDTYISTGDNFDSIIPSSNQLDLFSSFLKEINIPSIIIAAQSHESETPEDSILNHFGILNKMVTIVKEYQDGNKLFIGHFGLKESKINKFGATHSLQEFKKFRWGIFGHFHSYETIGKNCVQLGASRYVDFSEAQDKQKVILLIEDYDSDSPKCSFLALKSPYPMIDIELEQKTDKIIKSNPIKDPTKAKKVAPTKPQGANLSLKMTNTEALCAYLDKLDPNTKVRVCFRNYSQWSQFLNVSQKYRDKFIIFKEKKDFLISANNQKCQSEEKKPLKESLKKWMEANKIDKKIQSILLEEIK